jgi:hypothetical protein
MISMPIFVCLNRLLIFLINGAYYVNYFQVLGLESVFYDDIIL